MGLNSVNLVGRLATDPQERKVGEYITSNFTVAVDRDFGKEKTTDFLDCQAWGKTAEFINQYLKKGALVSVSGRVQKDTWKDKETNQNRSRVIIVADKVNGLEKRPSNSTTSEDKQIDVSTIPF